MEEIGWRMEDGGSRMEDRELNVERDPSIRYPLVSLSSISQLILYPPSSILFFSVSQDGSIRRRSSKKAICRRR